MEIIPKAGSGVLVTVNELLCRLDATKELKVRQYQCLGCIADAHSPKHTIFSAVFRWC